MRAQKGNRGASGRQWTGPLRVTTIGESERLGTIERLWEAPGATLDEALAEAERLMPEDGRLVDSYQVPSARILCEDDVYRCTSTSLHAGLDPRLPGCALPARRGTAVRTGS